MEVEKIASRIHLSFLIIIILIFLVMILINLFWCSEKVCILMIICISSKSSKKHCLKNMIFTIT